MKVQSVTAVDRLTGVGHLFYAGCDGIQEIREHQPVVECDKWYYDIIYDNGEMLRLFDFSSVGYRE